MPHDLLSAVGCLNAKDATDIFENTKAVGYILPEESRVRIENDTVGYLRVFRNHRELNTTIADVRVEDSLEAAFVTDLSIVHSADTL